MNLTQFAILIAAAAAALMNSQAQQNPAAILKSEFIADPLPTPSCHASTIVESEGVLMAAWFGGSEEGALDVGIWYSRLEDGKWTKAVEIANGRYPEERIQYPCWNPVLYRPEEGPLYLFYKEGPSPSSWWGMVKYSEDNGKSWSEPERLPDDIYGPIRSKPVQLADGTILAPSSTENAGWRVHMERTKNPLNVWWRTEPLNRAIDFGAIQPTIIQHPDGRLQILCRTKQRVITECWSEDNGYDWTRMRPTDLPNPNSAIDAIMMRDNRAVLLYNHTKSGRGTLNVAVSPDGKQWFAALVLEDTPGAEFSYPTVIQTADGLLHVSYTWNRNKIKHVILDPEKFQPQRIVEGAWPW